MLPGLSLGGRFPFCQLCWRSTRQLIPRLPVVRILVDPVEQLFAAWLFLRLAGKAFDLLIIGGFAQRQIERAMRGVTPALSACRRPLHRRLAGSGKASCVTAAIARNCIPWP
jgi:hypothetical protein